MKSHSSISNNNEQKNSDRDIKLEKLQKLKKFTIFYTDRHNQFVNFLHEINHRIEGLNANQRVSPNDNIQALEQKRNKIVACLNETQSHTKIKYYQQIIEQLAKELGEEINFQSPTILKAT